MFIPHRTFVFLLTLTSVSEVLGAPSSPRAMSDASLENVKLPSLEGETNTLQEVNQRHGVRLSGYLADFTLADALRYLSDYNYLPGFDSSEGAANIFSEEDIAGALRSMQTMMGIEPTGQLDDTTKRMMRSPRCGVPDMPESPISDTARSKRSLLEDKKWTHQDVSYKIINYTPDLDPRTVDRIFQQAFQEDLRDADIELEFVTGSHGDESPFDGPGGKLAHASYPMEGVVHFDDDETFTDDQNGTDLLQVAVHELGHALGLKHSINRNAIMWPDYIYRDNFRLHPEDIFRIQALYGPPRPTLSCELRLRPIEIQPVRCLTLLRRLFDRQGTCPPSPTLRSPLFFHCE